MLLLLITTIIFVWAIYGLHVLDLHRPALEALCKPVADWFGEAGNSVRAGVWVGAVIVASIAWLNPQNSFLGEMRGEITGMAITVIVIDELVGYRNALQEKKRIIQQMASRSNHFALDAVRQVRNYNWHLDGSLCKQNFIHANLDNAYLSFSNLTGADLSFSSLKNTTLNLSVLEGVRLEFVDLTEAMMVNANLIGALLFEANLTEACIRNSNLRGADLTNATLKRTQLFEVNLENVDLSNANLEDAILHHVNLHGTKYNADTIFPKGFDPVAAGAIKIDD